MHFEVVTLFPELVGLVGRFGVVGRALERGLLRLGTTDPREFATDRTAAWTTGPTAAVRGW
jgi:tRNA (guanine37-N1)-methyltransferase